MKLHFEFCHHSEIAASPAQSPVQIRILFCIGAYDRTVRGYQSESLDVIARQSESAREPSGSAAEDQAGSAGVRNHAGGKDQPCLLRCGINRSQQTTASDPGPARIGIN